MKEIIAISNQKGGVGKSSTANAIGAGLFQKGYKVLCVDIDAQANLTFSMGVTTPKSSSLDVLMGSVTAKDAIISTTQGDLIPASPVLSNSDILLIDTGKEYRLKEALEPILDDYDYIILDCPPALGILTINALTACTSVLVPVQTDIYSLQGVEQLIKTIQNAKKYCNSMLTIKGLVITRYNARSILSRDITCLLENTAKNLQTKLYQTKIRECTAIKEAQARQQDIFSYAPKSNAAIDYMNLITEIFL